MLRICWDGFDDLESGVATYSYQLFQLHPIPSPKPSRKLLAGPSNPFTVQHTTLQSRAHLLRLQHIVWQISNYFSTLLLGIHLWVAAHPPITSIPPPRGPLPAQSGTAQVQQTSRNLLQTTLITPVTSPLTPVITIDASAAPRGQLVTGLHLKYGMTYFAQVTATNNAALNSTSASTFQTASKAPSNRSLLIAIVVLASIGVSMLLVALLTAFVVRRRYETAQALLPCCLAV